MYTLYSRVYHVPLIFTQTNWKWLEIPINSFKLAIKQMLGGFHHNYSGKLVSYTFWYGS